MRSILAGILLTFCQVSMADNSLNPDTRYSPGDVVKLVLDALRTNDPANDDDGIAMVFRFASPGNRSQTGPLPRFTGMVKRGFGDMLNHVYSDFDDVKIEGDTALQSVWLTTPDGKEVGYMFQLGRQTTGEYQGMWMTESVWPLGQRPSTGQSI